MRTGAEDEVEGRRDSEPDVDEGESGETGRTSLRSEKMLALGRRSPRLVVGGGKIVGSGAEVLEGDCSYGMVMGDTGWDSARAAATLVVDRSIVLGSRGSRTPVPSGMISRPVD